MSDLPTPPKSLRFMGASDDEFIRVGDTIESELRDLANLRDPESIIDIGCGYGRVAHALLRHGHRGTYLGLDILADHIAWCTDHLTPYTEGRYQFIHLDLQNDRYNPAGLIAPAEVDLGMAGTSDVVMLTSVFTHMKPEGVAHYISQLPKLLEPGGRAMATFFLINDSQQQLEAEGASRYPLTHEVSSFCRYWSANDPLHVIGYDEAWVVGQAETAGLTTSAVHLGSWCGRLDAPVYQDTLIFRRDRPDTGSCHTQARS